jgi:hypothetical protein
MMNLMMQPSPHSRPAVTVVHHWMNLENSSIIRSIR